MTLAPDLCIIARAAPSRDPHRARQDPNAPATDRQTYAGSSSAARRIPIPAPQSR